MKKRTIILGYQGVYGIGEEFKKNLEYLGFEVIPISLDNSFTFRNIIQRGINFLNKKFFNNREIEKQQKLEPNLKAFNQKLKEIGGKVDYTLFIRSDDFPISFIKRLKKISSKMVCYHWDGLKWFPDAQKRIKYFDRFFVFDPADADFNKNIIPTTNFYFDYDIKEKNDNTIIGKNIYFLGAFINDRIKITADTTKYLKEIGYNPNIFIVAHRRDNIDEYKDSGIIFLDRGISFDENLQRMKDADVLIDFVKTKHNGLSFRTFEAIGYRKKLITTNAEVKNYDFYNPNNFFILNENNMHLLSDFLNKPYEPLNKEIIEKYSFTSWISYILDIELSKK